MYDKIKGIIYLTVLFRLIVGEWPDFSDPDYQRAIEECLTNSNGD